MTIRRNGAVALCAVALGSCTALAGDNPWLVTAYAGPASTQFVSQILSGNFDMNGAMMGLALDRRMVHITPGFSLMGEVQATQFLGKYTYGVGSIGLGLRVDEFPWSDSLPTSLSAYTGPSYAPDMPEIGYPKLQPAHRFLNYVSLELVFAFSPHWDAGLRLYHRSGAWGLYSSTADVGSTVGIAIRRRF